MEYLNQKFKHIIKRTIAVLMMSIVFITPEGGNIFSTPHGFVSISPNHIFTYTASLTLTSYHRRTSEFLINNVSIILDKDVNIEVKQHLYGDTLVVFSDITDTIDVYRFDISCIKHIFHKNIPLLKDVLVKNNILIAITYHGEESLDITVNSDKDFLSSANDVNIKPTIDNLALTDGSIPVWVPNTATYSFRGKELHIGEDVYPATTTMWYTQDHLFYQNLTSTLSFYSKDFTWFIDTTPITATISSLWGPILYKHTYQKGKWKKHAHYPLFDDIVTALKTRHYSHITIGQNKDIFVAITSTRSTIFFIYGIDNKKLHFKATKRFPDMFIIRGSYAISPRSGYIMKLGTWGAPIPPTNPIARIMLKIPFVVSNHYLDSLHIRWCRDDQK